MSSAPFPAARPEPYSRFALTAALLASAGWLWINFCRFPASPWNDVRLAPVFMAAIGEPVYTLPGTGVLTTWLYGPVPLWLWWPATLADQTTTALLAAGTWNLLLTAAAIALTCRAWPAPGLTGPMRGLAFAVILVLWPDHAWRFLQADNVAIALGLVANLLLLTRPGSRPHAWLAALATAGALGSKQTTLGLFVAQLGWLVWEHGRPAAVHHALRTATAGAGLLVLACLHFGAAELWFGLVVVPGALPRVEDLGARWSNLAPHLLFQAAIPLLLLGVITRRGWRPGEPLTLPALTFLGSLPLGLAGLFSTGGTINSFQGYGFLLPALVLCGIDALRRRPSRAWPLVVAAAVVLVATVRVGRADFAPTRPALTDVARAEALLAAQAGQLWLPWNPLVTYLNEGRFDHTEDGIYVRFITGHPVTRAHAETGLPPDVRAMAFPTPAMQWGVATKLAPPDATEGRFGPWLVVQWPATPVAENSLPSLPVDPILSAESPVGSFSP